MTVPVIEIRGVGQKTAEFHKNHGIITDKDLLKDGIGSLQQAPGFGTNRAKQVLKGIASSLAVDSKKSSARTDKKNMKKDKKKSGKDKKKSDKKKDKKKGSKKGKKKGNK